jgi:hypothetical protein
VSCTAVVYFRPADEAAETPGAFDFELSLSLAPGADMPPFPSCLSSQVLLL